MLWCIVCVGIEVMCWSTVEVCNLLQCIGLSQYEENFTMKKVEGKDLLAMQKQDFIVSDVVFTTTSLLLNYGSVFAHQLLVVAEF